MCRGTHADNDIYFLAQVFVGRCYAVVGILEHHLNNFVLLTFRKVSPSALFEGFEVCVSVNGAFRNTVLPG